MNEPRRLRDDPHSALERSLLDAGRSYTASASTRRRAMAVLGVAGLATTSTATAASLSKASLVKWAAVAAVAGGGALTAAHYLAKPAPVTSPAAPSAALAVPAVQAAATPPSGASDSADPAPAVSDDNPGPSAQVVTNAPRFEPRAAAPAALAAELSALDAARSSLSAGDPKGALASLDAYARNFPRGKLGLEAEVLRIAALAKSGQTAAARTRAEAFIKRHPDSVLASRVRGYVAL